MANCVQCGRKLPPLSFKRICEWCVQHEKAQRGEVDDDARQPVIAAPWTRQRESTVSLTKFLFGANLAVFVAMVAASRSIEAFPGEILGHFGANYGPYTLSGDWWRLLTYMFVHADIWHIGFNMWCLWSLGSLCESLYGSWTFGAVYLISGVAGGLASVAWHPTIPSVGASGAIFGLAGALIASLYLGEFSIPSYVIQANLKSLLFFVGFNVLFGISPIGDMFGVHVDNACHIGGLVSGLILGALIARLAPQENALIQRAVVLAVVALALVGGVLGVQRWRGAPFQLGRTLNSLQYAGPDNAIAQLRELVKQQPNSVAAHLALGQLYFNQSNFSQAEAELKEVLRLQPQNHSAQVDLGLTYLNEKQPENAKSIFTQALARDANDAEAHYGIGLALADEEKYQDAINEFKTAIAHGMQEAGVYFEIGHSYAKLNMYDEAIAAYGKEKEMNGDDPEIETALANAYSAKGMKQEATEASDKAAELKNAHHN
jgi:membrane associated rhomboid family serine protease/cytochrome c-type biogenesis protein CcmH/NrfG